MNIKIAKFTLILTLAGLAGMGVTTVHGGTSFSMQIVADNDFAVFGGTSSGVNDLLYQNNVSWSQQISDLSTLNFDLPAGDMKFYVLGLGGGGQENISGTVNGVDMTTIDVSMSSDLGPYLLDFESQNQGSGSVATGQFNANLSDVQGAFSHLTWGDPTINNSDAVIELASPNDAGFDFSSSTARLFSFDATEVGVQAVPEPSSIALATLVGVGLLLFRRRKF